MSMPSVDFNSELFFAAVQQEHHILAYDHAIRTLEAVSEAKITRWSKEDIAQINVFCAALFKLLMDENSPLPEELAKRFIKCNKVIKNLTAISEFKNTDRILAVILKQKKNNIPKIFILYSDRNQKQIPLEVLFKIHPEWAFLWWCVMVSMPTVYAEQTDRFIESLLNFPALETLAVIKGEGIKENIYCDPYFYASYVANDAGRRIKHLINQMYKTVIAAPKMHPNPDYKKLCVISAHFRKNHAVQKSLVPLLYPLKGHFHLTLLTTRNIPLDQLDTDLFDTIIYLEEETGEQKKLDVLSQDLADQAFGTIFYPDIGISQFSVFLSLLRIAPIQITGYGHPVSTFGSEIDYFLGSEDVELPQYADVNYSESLLLIPNAALPVITDMPRPEFTESAVPDRVMVVLNWGNQKFGAAQLFHIKEALRNAISRGSNITLKIISLHVKSAEYPVFERDITQWFSDVQDLEVQCHPLLHYPEYMECLSKADLAIDSYPFGSYNRIMDMLYLGIPVLTREGTHAMNRLASGILKTLKLYDLIARNDKDFIHMLISLITSHEQRQELRKKILEKDLHAIFSEKAKKGYFKTALDYTVFLKQHPELSKTKVITLGQMQKEINLPA